MAPTRRRLETRAVHAGDTERHIDGSLSLPIFRASVWEHVESGAEYHAVRYPRLNNLPNQIAVGAKLAALEGAEEGLVTSSGMAAISTVLFSVLGRGGHLLIQDQLYGGTHMLVTQHFAMFGLEYDFIDPEDPASWPSKLRPDTRAVYVEALTNPLLQVADHRAVVAFAREHGLVTLIDNTFTSPVNFRPIELGFDLSLHSGTKYLNGHNDLVAGAMIGKRALVDRARKLLNELGGSLDPQACYLLQRGIKTLAVRVRQQNENALTLARFLEQQPQVASVNYPGLESHPHHGRARELFDGFGGMLSFELAGGQSAAERLMERLEIPFPGPSLGGVESLITRPVATSHAGLSPDEREQLGIRDGLMRVSVGIEAVEDLVEDFAQALGD